MSEHLTPQQIEQYASRKTGTTARELLDFDEHLAGCAECRTKALAASGLSPASISMLPGGDDDPGHLEQELLEGYVDGTLGDVDKEIVEGHLEFCGDCAAEVAELRSFRSMLSAQPDKAYSPDPAAGMYQRMEATSTATRRPAFRFAPAFAMAASILVAAVVIWQIHGSSDKTTQPRQVADSRAPQSSTPAPDVAPPPPSMPPAVTPSAPQTVTPSVPHTTLPAPSAPSRDLSIGSTPGAARSTQPLPPPPPTVALKPSSPEPGPSPMMDNIGAARPNEQMAKVGPKSEASPPVQVPAAAAASTASTASVMDDKSASGAVHKDEEVPQPGGFAGGGGYGGAVENRGGNGFAAAPPPAGAPAPAFRSNGPVGMGSLSAGAGRNEQLPASVRGVLASGHLDLDTPEIRDLTTVDANAHIGEAPAPFNVSSPVGTALLSDRPTFSWQQAKDGSTYQVIITDRDGGAVDVSPSITSTAWRADKALPTGQVLKWQVKAIANGTSAGTSPNGGARFRVLDPDRAAQIRDAQKTFADQPLALGILYAQAGMLDEAQRALERAHKQDPQNEIVPKLLADVKAVRDNSASL